VRLIPYGVHGRLSLGEVATSVSPTADEGRTALEWVVPMPMH